MKALLIALVAFYSVNAKALTNSQPALNTKWDSVVQIISDAPDENGDDTPGYCNATLVAKNTLITAAHCIKLLYLSGKSDLKIQVGYYKSVTRPDGRVVRIGYVKKHEETLDVGIEISESLKKDFLRKKYKSNIGPGEDMALIHWSEEDPKAIKLFSELKPIAIVSKKEHALIIKNLKAYNFKLISINFFNEMSTDTKREAVISSLASKSGHLTTSQSLARVQEGDSGAPLLINHNGEEKIFSVVKGKATTIFSNWDVYSNVHENFCEMVRKIPNDLSAKYCL